MSKEALQVYEQALKEQHNRNEARRIRTKVTEARQSPHSAGPRWPFELLQNALDAGPRSGQSSVNVRVHRDKSHLIFEHDGAPFTTEDLAALLSGGSSKDFESETTTGRFGTGFLATHVLAERTHLEGVLSVPMGCEHFGLTLDRGGDEEAILANITSCNHAIEQAQPLPTLDGTPSARFLYPISEDSPLLSGFEALRRSLPYLFLTRHRLGCVELSATEATTEVWVPGEVQREECQGGYVQYRSLRVECEGTKPRELRVFRFLTEEHASSSALVVVEPDGDGWVVRLPAEDAPRVYRQYPLRGSGFIPLNFVLDGAFGPDQERSKVLMSDEDRNLLAGSLLAAVVGVKYAFSQGWRRSHLLARAAKPTSAFDPADSGEVEWWIEHLRGFAERLAALPIVECTSGYLPAITPEGWYADFVLPRLLPDSTVVEASVERMWPLAAAATALAPPREHVAAEWTEIAEGWHELGLKVSRISISQLASIVREDAQSIDALRVTGDQEEWLAGFLDLVGECWDKRSGVELSVLAGLLPDQKRLLRSPTALRRDDGIPDRLKDICEDMGYVLRKQLLLGRLFEIGEHAGLPYLREALTAAVPTSIDEETVLECAAEYLDATLPEDQECDPETAGLQASAVRFARYLWDTKNVDAAQIARRLPIVTSRQRAVRWSPTRMMMAPVCTWDASARPFAAIYPSDRVLADLYGGSEDAGVPECVTALVNWGIAFADPIARDTPSALRDRRLQAISLPGSDTAGVIVSDEEFSQIALLDLLVLQCQEEEDARALLGLVLCHIAPHDSAWLEERVIRGRKGGDEVEIPVRPALWLGDLKFRAWVPFPGEDGKPAKVAATSATLKHLLCPSWLEGNDAAIRLLSEWFEFDELELRLLGIAPDEVWRREVRKGLARLVESVGADPELYTALADEVQARRKRRREVERCRRMGLAVQEAIRSSLEAYGLSVTLVDHGFDYEVALRTDNALEEASQQFEVGPYLLEVKATSTGGARLTPTQAQTASEDVSRYVLCVVDLRGLSENELDSDWNGERVQPLARIVPDIGGSVQETRQLVETATCNSVALRNESALRYEVPVEVWEAGMSIEDWVGRIAAQSNGSGA